MVTVLRSGLATTQLGEVTTAGATRRVGTWPIPEVICATDVFGTSGRTLFAAAITTLRGTAVDSPPTFGTVEVKDVGKSPIDKALEASTIFALNAGETLLSTTAETSGLDDIGQDSGS